MQSPIVFNPVIGHEVRATDMSVPFPEDKTFGVWALDSSNQSIYIDNQQISHQDGVWTSSSLPLWPVSSSLDFVAYSPYTLPVRLDGGAIVLDDFSVTEDGTDMLFAQTASGLTAAQGEVKLPFAHALAKLDVRVANGFGDGFDLRMDKIVLKGVAMRGNFHSTRRPCWRIDESTFDDIIIYDSGRDGQFLAGTRMQFVGQACSIIPQAVKPSIELTYSFRVDQGEWIDGQKESVELKDVYWETGRYYTYSLRISETKVSCTAGIGHWNERS